MEVFDQIKKWPEAIQKEWGKYVESIIKVERIREKFDTKLKKWSKSSENSYYLSTVMLSSQVYSRAIRGHWGIENRNHCVKDVSMGEDKSRIRINPDRFATLRSFSLNILRANKVENIKNERYRNSINLDRLFQYKQLLN